MKNNVRSIESMPKLTCVRLYRVCFRFEALFRAFRLFRAFVIQELRYLQWNETHLSAAQLDSALPQV
jgi:hypothetical protein